MTLRMEDLDYDARVSIALQETRKSFAIEMKQSPNKPYLDRGKYWKSVMNSNAIFYGVGIFDIEQLHKETKKRKDLANLKPKQYQLGI